MTDENDEESNSSEDPQPGIGSAASGYEVYQAMREALEPIDKSFRDIANLYNVSAVRKLQEIGIRNAELVSSLTRPLDLALIQAVHEQAARNTEIIRSLYGPGLNVAAWAQVGETVRGLQTQLAAQASAFRIPVPDMPVFDFGTARIAADMSAALRAMGSAPFNASVLSPRTLEEAADALEEAVAAKSVDTGREPLLAEEEIRQGVPAELEQQVEVLASQVEEAVAAAGRISRQTRRVIVNALVFAIYWEVYVLLPEATDTVLDAMALIALARGVGDKFYGEDE